MKRKQLFIIAFSLLLYIAPVLFATSYVPSTIPIQQDCAKDFIHSSEPWLTGWSRRKSILIAGATGAGTNYSVSITVPYDSDMNANFSDIRFTDNDKITLLDHWRESYTASTTSLFWVKVSDDLGTAKYIYMYYGNDEVDTASNGTATFLFYEDWSSQSLDNWINPANQADGQTTFSITDASQGYVAHIEADPADSYLINSDFNKTAPFATRFRANIEEATTSGNTGRIGTGWVAKYGWAFIQTSYTSGEGFSVYDDLGNADSQAMTPTFFDSWETFEIQRGIFIAGYYTVLTVDDSQEEIGSFDPDAISNPVCSIHVIDSEQSIYCDWVVCRKFQTVEPAFSSFGSEEINKDWHTEDIIYFYLLIPFDYWAYDMLLLFLGLVLMVVAACYFVYGGRKEFNTNKIFWAFVMFAIGCALFLGGI